MNLHLNPFEKELKRQEEEKRKEDQQKREDNQLQLMLSKLNKMQEAERKKHINVGSAQILASSQFSGVIHENKINENKDDLIKPKVFDIPNAFIKYDKNPDFIIDTKKSGMDEHDFLMYADTNDSDSTVDQKQKILNEIKQFQENPDYNLEIKTDTKKIKEGNETMRNEDLKNTKPRSVFENDESNENFEDQIPNEGLTEQWEENLSNRLNRKYSNDNQINSLSNKGQKVVSNLKKIDEIIENDEKKLNNSDEDFDYNEEAFGTTNTFDFDNNDQIIKTKTLQEDDFISDPEEVIDFFEIDENDMSFALNLIKGTEVEDTKLLTRDKLISNLRKKPKHQQIMGIIGNKQYLSDAYFEIKKQLDDSFFIHLNLRKTYMYDSPVLFITKHLISQLPEVSSDDKKILWKRCANLLSATKFANTKHSEELIFDKELAITDPITNIRREFKKVLNAYDLAECKFIIIVDEIRGIDDADFLNCVSYLTLVFDGLTNFKLIFEIDSSFVKINAKSTKLRLGISMIDYFSAQNKILIENNRANTFKNNNAVYDEILDRTYNNQREIYLEKNHKNKLNEDFKNIQLNEKNEQFARDLIKKEQQLKRAEEIARYNRQVKLRDEEKRLLDIERKKLEKRQRELEQRYKLNENDLNDYKNKSNEIYGDEDDYEDEYFDDRDYKTNDQIKPIRSSEVAQRYENEPKSDTFEFSKDSNNTKRNPQEKLVVRNVVDIKKPNGSSDSRIVQTRLMGQENIEFNDDENNFSGLQMVSDGNGYKFKRKKYVSSYIKDNDKIDLDEAEKIVSQTNDDINDENSIGTISIKANLARKKRARAHYEDELRGIDDKLRSESDEEDFSRFVKK